MRQTIKCAALSVALEQLGELAKEDKERNVRTIIFCEDRLTLAAERAVCSAIEGTMTARVFPFSRFLATYGKQEKKVLSTQGSVMTLRRIIEENRDGFRLFRRLSSTDAAQSMYDTIALLYSSGISPENMKDIPCEGIFADKLHDIQLIYEKYSEYLEENSLEDRNNYLRRMDEDIRTEPVVRGARIVFLGYQAFTKTGEGVIRASFANARDVCGIFIAGKEDFYVNEAYTTYKGIAREFGGAPDIGSLKGLPGSAETLRKKIFDADSFVSKERERTSSVMLLEAQDGSEEFEFIAAEIKRIVANGVRYAKISVMLPNLAETERELSRVFAQYRIPYYADRVYSLSTHPLCAFVVSLLCCLFYGCRPGDVDDVVASPFFPAGQDEKDEFRNYMLRVGTYRGAVQTEPDKDICDTLGYNYDTVTKVRATFMDAFTVLKAKARASRYEAVKAVLEMFGAEEKAEQLSGDFADSYPAEAEFSHRAYGSVLGVLAEAEGVTYDLGDNDYLKVIRSGFAAKNVSLIPPKADAVFVGDLQNTANTGSDFVFCARLTGDVPAAMADASLLNDKDIATLEAANVQVAPKIKQINARRRETTALNVCSFRARLVLSYPARLNGEECTPSEIISYASSIFCGPDGGKLEPVKISELTKDRSYVPFYCSETIPAVKWIVSSMHADTAPAVYSLLCEHGKKADADMALKKTEKGLIQNGEKLYMGGGTISPTTLETYFNCPYQAFMKNGLGAQERLEGGMHATDSGNFVHEVLKDVSKELNDTDTMDDFVKKVNDTADELLKQAPYSAMSLTKSGQYNAEKLREELDDIACGLYEQAKASAFKVAATEQAYSVDIAEGVRVYGRIDRVDTYDSGSGRMLRIIDYKTGTFDASPMAYYTGQRLQLELYLLAASTSTHSIPVAAYYFPAQVAFKSEEDGVFRMTGFMNGSDEVVRASDTTLEEGEKSKYINAAYMAKKNADTAMDPDTFMWFLDYSRQVAGNAAMEMKRGNITPSPAENTCKYCKYGGSCGFGVGRDGGERKADWSVKCRTIAQIAENSRRQPGGEGENGAEAGAGAGAGEGTGAESGTGTDMGGIMGGIMSGTMGGLGMDEQVYTTGTSAGTGESAEWLTGTDMPEGIGMPAGLEGMDWLTGAGTGTRSTGTDTGAGAQTGAGADAINTGIKETAGTTGKKPKAPVVDTTETGAGTGEGMKPAEPETPVKPETPTEPEAPGKPVTETAQGTRGTKGAGSKKKRKAKPDTDGEQIDIFSDTYVFGTDMQGAGGTGPGTGMETGAGTGAGSGRSYGLEGLDSFIDNEFGSGADGNGNSGGQSAGGTYDDFYGAYDGSNYGSGDTAYTNLPEDLGYKDTGKSGKKTGAAGSRDTGTKGGRDAGAAGGESPLYGTYSGGNAGWEDEDSSGAISGDAWNTDENDAYIDWNRVSGADDADNAHSADDADDAGSHEDDDDGSGSSGTRGKNRKRR